jgi:hypothetical protein
MALMPTFLWTAERTMDWDSLGFPASATGSKGPPSLHWLRRCRHLQRNHLLPSNPNGGRPYGHGSCASRPRVVEHPGY